MEVIGAQDVAERTYRANALKDGVMPTATGIADARAAAGPSMLQKYGPSAGLGISAMYLGGGFDTPKDPVLPDIPTGTDLIEDDPGKYLIHDLGSLSLNQETGEYEDSNPMPPTYTAPTYTAPGPVANTGYVPQYDINGALIPPSSPLYNPFSQPVQAAAEGGPIFPRRNGGIAPEEGVEGEDSVRAMLMPGEFVMTTDAVRGLGNGNLNNGIKNMYSVMRDLESRGRGTV